MISLESLGVLMGLIGWGFNWEMGLVSLEKWRYTIICSVGYADT